VLLVLVGGAKDLRIQFVIPNEVRKLQEPLARGGGGKSKWEKESEEKKGGMNHRIQKDFAIKKIDFRNLFQCEKDLSLLPRNGSFYEYCPTGRYSGR
jgi:hypothetical protein